MRRRRRDEPGLGTDATRPYSLYIRNQHQPCRERERIYMHTVIRKHTHTHTFTLLWKEGMWKCLLEVNTDSSVTGNSWLGLCIYMVSALGSPSGLWRGRRKKKRANEKHISSVWHFHIGSTEDYQESMGYVVYVLSWPSRHWTGLRMGERHQILITHPAGLFFHVVFIEDNKVMYWDKWLVMKSLS